MTCHIKQAGSKHSFMHAGNPSGSSSAIFLAILPMCLPENALCTVTTQYDCNPVWSILCVVVMSGAVPAEMVEVLNAQSGKGLTVKAAFAREAESPGESSHWKMVLRQCVPLSFGPVV